MKPAPDEATPASSRVEDYPPRQPRERLGIKNKLALVGQGAWGSLISSFCCLLPAIAIAIIGLTGGLATTLVSLGRFRLYGIMAGLAFIAIASWFSLRQSRACCTEEEYKRRQIAIPLIMFASFGIVYGLTMYLLLPVLYKMG